MKKSIVWKSRRVCSIEGNYIAIFPFCSSKHKGKVWPYFKQLIKEIKSISKPGRIIYARAYSISKIKNGLGVAIVSTSKGIMSDNDARTKNIGGEIICRVF